MTGAEMEAFVDELYAATAAGDWARVATMVTDDMLITEADGLPMAGRYEGPNALRDLFTKVFGMLDVAALDRVQMTTGGDYAATILRMRFADPALAPAELCEVFRFRDGRCCEIKPYYFDPAPVIAAAKAGTRAG